MFGFANCIVFEGGRIIFFSSTLTSFALVPPTALLYVATKGAIEQLNRVLAKELGPKGITVNTISPGPIDTDMFRNGKTEQQIKFFEGLHPQKRIGLPEEVAPLVAFLASDGSSWINGQNIRINGVSILSLTLLLTVITEIYVLTPDRLLCIGLHRLRLELLEQRKGCSFCQGSWQFSVMEIPRPAR